MSAIQQILLAGGVPSYTTPTYVGTGTVAHASKAGNVSVGAISGAQAGDLILLVVLAASDAYLDVTATGYSSVVNVNILNPAFGNIFKYGLLYKVATGSDSSVTVDVPGGDAVRAYKILIRGTDPVAPFMALNDLSKTTVDTPPVVTSFPSVNIQFNDPLILFIGLTTYNSSYSAPVVSGATTTTRINNTSGTWFTGGTSLRTALYSSVGHAGNALLPATSTTLSGGSTAGPSSQITLALRGVPE